MKLINRWFYFFEFTRLYGLDKSERGKIFETEQSKICC